MLLSPKWEKCGVFVTRFPQTPHTQPFLGNGLLREGTCNCPLDLKMFFIAGEDYQREKTFLSCVFYLGYQLVIPKLA
jgi:hypothetical protein